MRFTIVRHGETKANKEDNLQGQLPGELSVIGLAQAHALAEELKKHQFDIFLSTDLKRGLDTAKIIAEFHDKPLLIDTALRERSFGIFEGTNRTAFYSHERSLADPYNHRPEKGESFMDLYERAKHFVNRITEKYAHKSVLAASHGDFVRMCLGVLQALPIEKACQISQANACINVLQLSSNGAWQILKFNDTNHLGPEITSNNLTDV